MKSPSTLILVLLLLLIPGLHVGQSNCMGSYKAHYLNSNNIRASFFPRGNKFTEGSGDSPSFQVPYSPEHRLSTIYASTPWIGGFDDAGNLKLAGERFPATKPDFQVGPLTIIGLPIDSVCGYFDRTWNVYSEDIISHQNDFYIDGIIDDTIASIFGWPAHGNQFFSRFNNFELPTEHDRNWAPFFDANGNDKYDPDKGDHPVLYVTFSSKQYIPDQMMWMVFNDVRTHLFSGADPLRVEIQLTAYAFHCQDNELLNNTIFNSYKILNRAVSATDSVFFGMWTDYDLGCALDDFIGSDSSRNTEFVYNADEEDGDSLLDCSTGFDTYATKPPAQSMTYLSHPMHSFISYSSVGTTGLEMYNGLNGVWRDGSHIIPVGEGYDPASTKSPTRFLFHGDPRDTSSWAAINVSDGGSDIKTVSSVNLGRLDPGEIEFVELAYIFHHDPKGDHLDQVTEMYANVDLLLSSLNNLDEPCTLFPVCEDEECVWPGDFNHDGEANHVDLLIWGVMNQSEGASSNRQVNWRGRLTEDWMNNTIDGVNFKHGDGSGDGIIDFYDLETNGLNFLSTVPDHQKTNHYPYGPELVLTSSSMMSNGQIPLIRVETGTEIKDVLGIAYEVEFDTSVFELKYGFFNQWPADTNTIAYGNETYRITRELTDHSSRFGFVQSDHQEIDIDSGTLIQRSSLYGFTLKPGLALDDIPDSTIFRLRNLVAIDAEGNNLNIGANELVVYKYGLTSVDDPVVPEISIYPNPARSHIFIDVPDQTRFEIYNLQAQITQVLYTNGQSLDVSDYIPGLYYLRFPSTGQVCKLVIE